MARASRRFPQLLDLLKTGALSLTNIRLLAPHLTQTNVDETLRAARHARKEAVKLLIAKLHPEPPVPSVVRKLPEVKTAQVTEPQAAPALVLDPADVRPAAAPLPASRRPVVAPLSEAHYRLQVTISAQSRDRLRRVQDLMRHIAPSGDPAVVVERALELLEADLMRKKAAAVARPRRRGDAPISKGRHIPHSVKRQVWARDKGQCAFTAGEGRRCRERGSLEYHHVDPFARGGRATTDNIELRCRAHNGFEWERDVEITQ